MSRDAVDDAARRTVRLGAIPAYDDCVGGDLRASPEASDEQRAALAEYRRLAREHHSYVRGPELAEYYRSRP